MEAEICLKQLQKRYNATLITASKSPNWNPELPKNWRQAVAASPTLVRKTINKLISDQEVALEGVGRMAKAVLVAAPPLIEKLGAFLSHARKMSPETPSDQELLDNVFSLRRDVAEHFDYPLRQIIAGQNHLLLHDLKQRFHSLLNKTGSRSRLELIRLITRTHPRIT